MLCDRLLKCGLVTGAPLGTHGPTSSSDGAGLQFQDHWCKQQRETGWMSSILDDSQEKRKPGCRKNTNPRTQTSFGSYVAAPSEKNVLKAQGLVPGTAINK